jgi:hypothetical protein
MILFYRQHIDFLSEHAVDPDKRRYAVAEEGPRHYIDLDHYKDHLPDSLPRYWNAALARFGEDSLMRNGIVPWWIEIMQKRLTAAFRENNSRRILKLSAEIGHYLSDAHVPLHANSNHNGQFSGQHGIHAFWESRIPELLMEKEWDLFIGRADYIRRPSDFIWKAVLESGLAADSVLRSEKELTERFPGSKKFAFEERNGKIIRQYSSAFSKAYDRLLNGMIERRLRQSIYATASFWYTAWVDAGQPDLITDNNDPFTNEDREEFEGLNRAWRTSSIKGRPEGWP